MLRQRKIIFIVTAIVLSVIGFISCIDTSKEAPADPRGNQYAGADACISCHQNVYDSYLHTAHYNTSRPPTDSGILGNFSAPGNDFFYNDSMKVTMSKKTTVILRQPTSMAVKRNHTLLILSLAQEARLKRFFIARMMKYTNCRSLILLLLPVGPIVLVSRQIIFLLHAVYRVVVLLAMLLRLM